MRFSETASNIFKAMSDFRKNLVQPSKDAKNPFFKNNYVTLDGIVKAIDDAIKGTGLSYTQEAMSEGNSVKVSTYILHESGEYMALDPLTLPASKADAQAFGSAVTYAKRYALAAAFGVTSDVDDDGNDAVGDEPKQGQKQDRTQKSKAPQKAPAKNQDAPKLTQPEINKLQASAKDLAELITVKTNKETTPGDTLSKAIINSLNKSKDILQLDVFEGKAVATKIADWKKLYMAK